MITILKRTRTITPSTDPKTYSDWSEWASTSDAPPYNNTDLIEYKIDTTFKDKYLSIYSELMQEAIKDNTPYAQSILYMSEQLNQSSLTPKDKALLQAQYMANITNAVTIQGMQVAMSLTDRDLRIDDDLAMLKVQREITEATKDVKIAMQEIQKESMEAERDYTKEKKTQLIDSVKFNNMKSALDYFGEAYGMHRNGGGVITASMWKPPLEISLAIATSNANPTFTFNPSTITTSE